MAKSNLFHRFEAVASQPLGSASKIIKGVLRHRRNTYSVEVIVYSQNQQDLIDKNIYLRLIVNPAISLKWNDEVEVEFYLANRFKKTINLRILGPALFSYSLPRMTKHLAWLQVMSGSLKEALEGLALKKGSQGLGESEIKFFFALPLKKLKLILEEGEGEGRWKILNHHPYLIYHPQILNFLEQKILRRLTKYHQQQPDDLGMTISKMRKNLGISARATSYLANRLTAKGLLRRREDYFYLPEFQPQLTAQEIEILKQMETSILKGDLLSLSVDKLQQRTGLPRRKLNMLLTMLIDQQKIIKSKDGYYLHYQWLEELIKKIRASGQKEITITEFKQLTGLSRKYAIPLLELLDQIGVTRRKTPSVREILPD